MKKTLLILCLLFTSASAFGFNGIDSTCPQLTYKSAPQVNADQYICHTEYAVAYSWASRDPIYTTEYLIKSHTGTLPRTNDFRVDPAIDPHHQATPNDYYKSTCNGGRCDKGHMTPDQDFSACAACVHESFFMDNMVPQNYKNNEIIWKQMEMMIRTYVSTHPAGVYVITGPAYRSVNPATIGKNKVWVPDLLWKIAIDAATGKSIAFMMPNAPETNLASFVTSISVIEQSTGIQFDPALNKTTIANFQDWKK